MKVKDFGELTEAEQGLIAHLRKGAAGVYWASHEIPAEDAPKDLHIRASLIRALALKKLDDCPLPERGLEVLGAYIRGDRAKGGETPGLDFEGAILERHLGLYCCRIPDAILLRDAVIKSLDLSRSLLSGELCADRLEARGSVFLRYLEAAREIRLLGAKLGGDLSCNGARLTHTDIALHADGLETRRGIFLEHIEAAGEIRLLGAKLGGDLACDHAKFLHTEDALNADGIDAKGCIYLLNIEAAGKVRLIGATLGGDLSCNNATLQYAEDSLRADMLTAKGSIYLRNIRVTGAIWMQGMTLDGSLECSGAHLIGTGTTLCCQNARIARTWLWNEKAHSAGAIDLTSAEIGSVCDASDNWPPEILLNRCHYGAFTGKGVSGAERIKWLSRMKPHKYGHEFWPHPYEECARVLREAGHGADAREVLIEKERLQRQAKRQAIRNQLQAAQKKQAAASPSEGYRPHMDQVIGARARLATAHVWDWLLAKSVDYGRRPGKAAIWLACVWLIGAFMFARAAGFGDIKPNLPQIQRGPEWIACSAQQGTTILDTTPLPLTGRAYPDENQLDCFLRQPQAGAYPRFDPLIYSADTLLPIVSLEMQSYWIPDDRKPIGNAARLYLWLHIAAGWALTLLAVAGFSGLIKTDNTK